MVALVMAELDFQEEKVALAQGLDILLELVSVLMNVLTASNFFYLQEWGMGQSHLLRLRLRLPNMVAYHIHYQ